MATCVSTIGSARTVISISSRPIPTPTWRTVKSFPAQQQRPVDVEERRAQLLRAELRRLPHRQLAVVRRQRMAGTKHAAEQRRLLLNNPAGSYWKEQCVGDCAANCFGDLSTFKFNIAETL